MKQEYKNLFVVSVLRSDNGEKCIEPYGFKQNGSAVLIVVLVMGALSIFSISVWRNTVFLHDIVLKKQEYERSFRSAEAALNMGIALCKKYPKRFFLSEEKDSPHPARGEPFEKTHDKLRRTTKSNPFSATIDPWLSKKHQKAVIQIYPDTELVLVRAFLLKKDQVAFGLRCTVELAGLKGKKQLVEIKNWAIETKQSMKSPK